MGKMKAVLGSGSNIVDFTYVRNVTLGHILAASKLGKDSIVNGKAYHITNDEPVPFWVFTGEILNRFGYKAPSTHVPAWLVMFVAYVLQMVSILLSPFVQWKPFLTPFKVALASTDHYYSCDRAKQELGYSPKVSLRKGIDLTCEHFRTK